MSFSIVTHNDRDVALLLLVPNVRDDGSLRISYSFATDLSSGGSGRENREPRNPTPLLTQTCSYLLTTAAEAGALRAGLAALGDALVAVPLWCDKLTGAQWSDRIHTPAYLVRLSDGAILAGNASLTSGIEYAPLLFGRLKEQPDARPWTDEGGCEVEITVLEDSEWDYRIQINATATPGTWPEALSPNYTGDMTDRSETGREYVTIGVGRVRGIERQEIAFKWGQEASFLLQDRSQIRTMLATFVAHQGRVASLAMPWWFKPAADDPATPHETVVRFAADKLELAFDGGAVARTQLAFWQVPWEVEGIEGETPAQPARAYLYRHTLRTPTSPVVWRFTDYSKPITVTEDSVEVTYTPALIEHDRISQGMMLDDDAITLKSFVSASHPWMLILQRKLEAPLDVDVFEIEPEAETPVPVLRYSGEIAGTPTGRGRQLSAPTSVLGGLLDIKVPRFFLQEGCNHELGSVGCGLDIADFTFTGTVVSISGAQVVVSITANPPSWTLTDDTFAGGDAEIGAGLTYEGRDILTSEDLGGGQQRLTLQRAFRGLAVSDTITFRPGCSGTWTECQRFGNTVKYGGHRHIGPDNISVPARETNTAGGKK
ncbi:MAG TPA: phage BR0599 family protein [Opitutaceae bacterium]